MKNKNNILIVGSGYMGREYLRVLKKLGKLKKTSLYSRSKKNNNIFKSFGKKIELFKNLKSNNNFSHAIVCVNENQIHKVVSKLIGLKIKNILVEKPGGKNLKEIKSLNKQSIKQGCRLNVAYNRRFYENIHYLKKLIKKDGKIISAQFSFTEWIDKIKKLNYTKNITRNWFYFNSLHLVDLVFHIIGLPKKISAKSSNYDKLFGKKVFVGSGITNNNVFFSYHSNWASAGRWSIELFTKKNKFILSPLEEIHVQKKNQLDIKKIDLKKKHDNKFKPGIFLITKKFLTNNKILLYKDYVKLFNLYSIISRGN